MIRYFRLDDIAEDTADDIKYVRVGAGTRGKGTHATRRTYLCRGSEKSQLHEVGDVD